MKRIACFLFALTGVLAAADSARADWGSAQYGGYQPWWNIFANAIRTCRSRKNACSLLARLLRFAAPLLRPCSIASTGLPTTKTTAINQPGLRGCGPNGGTSRVQFAPVFVSPQMNWAVPNTQAERHAGVQLSTAANVPGANANMVGVIPTCIPVDSRITGAIDDGASRLLRSPRYSAPPTRLTPCQASFFYL